MIVKNKKAIAGALALSMAVPVSVWAGNSSYISVPKTVEVPKYSYGDLNGDGEVDLQDVQRALNIYLESGEAPTQQEILSGDLDGDGSIDLSEVQTFLQWYLDIGEPVVKTSQQPQASTPPSTSDSPAESEAPDSSEAPAESAAPQVSAAPTASTAASNKPLVPSLAPVISKAPVSATPVPRSKFLSAEAVTYAITSDSVTLVATNGAIEENGIYTLTEQNEAAQMGIQFAWPYVGKTALRQTVADAGVEDGVTAEIFSKYQGTFLNEGWLKNNYDSNTDDVQNFVYPRPEWSNGISISFWSKQKWSSSTRSNVGPLMVIRRNKYCVDNAGTSVGYGGVRKHHGDDPENTDFALMLCANGTVVYLAGGADAANGFHTDNYISDEDDTWTFYTVTIANDFITVYVNGQEMVYQSVYMDKEWVGSFNRGFMTRYNPTGWVTQEMVDEDNALRGYLSSTSPGKSNVGAWTVGHGLNWDATLSGNRRYNGDTKTLDAKPLLVDLLTEEGVELWFGGVETCTLDANQSDTVPSNYAKTTSNGSQVTGVQCYPLELKAGEVAAVYENAKTEYKDVLGLED